MKKKIDDKLKKERLYVRKIVVVIGVGEEALKV